ncbi:MAG TPA: Gfo/Idh/MocA family oxidoreductase [bacterium]|nr:Gfo/Idh/MocA family oxidoreductase [bacterium]
MIHKHPSDRRDFMKTSGLLAAAISLGAAPAITANAQDSGNLIQVGWIGTGSRGNHLLRKVVKLPNVKVTALCDLWPPNLASGVQYCADPNIQTYQRYEEMLEKADIDCVVVTSPIHWHARHSIAAMKAGKYVFCEKTMALTIDEATEMVKVSEQTGKFLQVGLQRRYSPIYRKALSLIYNECRLGRITLIRCQWNRNMAWRRGYMGEDFPPGKEYDVVRECYPDYEHWWNWRFFWESSGGIMTELGSHQLDVASWVLGCHPSAVMGVGGKDYWLDDREIFDNVNVIYEFKIEPNDHNRKAFFSSEPTGLAECRQGEEALRKLKEDPYIAKVVYTSIGANSHDGASEQIMGEWGTILLTTNRGVLFHEPSAPEMAWGDKAMSKAEQAARAAAVITSGATHNLSMAPQEDQGEPVGRPMAGMDFEDIELSEFFDCVRSGRKPYCDVVKGRNDAVMVLSANTAMLENRRIELGEDLYM